MADLRILQANERTFLAWVRTGLALIVFGFALARVAVWLEPMEPQADDGPLVGLGIALIAMGATVPVWAALRHAKIREAILADAPITPSPASTYVLAGVLATVSAGLVLWLALD